MPLRDNKISANQIIKKLHLAPLKEEGGMYAQTYISNISIPKKCLPRQYCTDKSIFTQIYFLLNDEEDSFSAMHKLCTDEVYHFYLGDPVEMLLLYPRGKSRIICLGSNIFKGEKVQFVVPHGVWQGSYIKTGGKFSLMGCSMSPGFDISDFELGERETLTRLYPEKYDLINKLTRK